MTVWAARPDCSPEHQSDDAMIPVSGDIARVRQRQYLVEEVVPPPEPGQQTLVRLSCLDDDAQGVLLEVLCEMEVDAQVLRSISWASVAQRGFDPPRLFSAMALRWNCVTSTEPPPLSGALSRRNPDQCVPAWRARGGAHAGSARRLQRGSGARACCRPW